MKEMIKVFKKANIIVNSYKIDSIKAEDIKQNVTIGLAFPVAFQSTFPFIWDFFKKFPQANKTPIFMVDTMMSFSGGIMGPLKKLFKQKGYDCIGAKEIIMPNNWLRKSINPEKDNEKIKNGLMKARLYAELLINGDAKWGRIPFLSDFVHKLCCNKLVMNKINLAQGKKIEVEKAKCVHCGLCSKICPINNISFDNYPLWGKSCQLCMRCLSYCPSNAIIIQGKKFIAYNVVKIEEIMNDSV